MFRLVKSETMPLTSELALRFANMEASPTERQMNDSRVKHLKEKGEKGLLVTFHWSQASWMGKLIRMNGQHSSKALIELDGAFPQGLMVHLDTYECPTKEDLALLFRQFDDRKSSRGPADVSSAYQGIYDEIRDIDHKLAKTAIEGVAWWRRAIQGEAGQAGDDIYAAFGEQPLYGFIRWLSEVFSVKTQEMNRIHVVAAMYATFKANEAAAREFWHSVARGGPDYDDAAPAAVLDNWLKEAHDKERRQKLKLKPANFYQGCVFGWNAFREEKPLRDIKFDTKKGYLEVVG